MVSINNHVISDVNIEMHPQEELSTVQRFRCIKLYKATYCVMEMLKMQSILTT